MLAVVIKSLQKIKSLMSTENPGIKPKNQNYKPGILRVTQEKNFSNI